MEGWGGDLVESELIYPSTRLRGEEAYLVPLGRRDVKHLDEFSAGKLYHYNLDMSIKRNKSEATNRKGQNELGFNFHPERMSWTANSLKRGI